MINLPHNIHLEFTLDSKKVLNANKKLHHIVNAQIVNYLRSLAASEGIKIHPNKQLATDKLNALNQERIFQLAKKRAKNAAKKLGQTPTEQQLNENFDHLLPEVRSTQIDVPPLYDYFKIVVTVNPPTKRRMDPPNLYPTVKALIDGLTDASLWSDDDYNHLAELSFKYGSPTQQRNTFKIEFDITSIEEN